MKKWSLFLIVTAAALLVSGCQPTPEQAVVVGKDLEQMIKAATAPGGAEGSPREALGAPERYESYIEDTTGKFKITVDADVIMPDANMPIVWVEAQPFGQDTVDRLISALFDGGKLYDPNGMSELKKSEVADRLTQLRLKKAELEQQGMKPLNPVEEDDTGEASASSSEVMASQGNLLDSVNESITIYENLLKAAPEEKKLIEVTGELQPINITAGLSEEDRKSYEGKLMEKVHVAQADPKGGMSSLFVVNNEESNSYTAVYVSRGDFDTNFGLYNTSDIWYESANANDRAAADLLPPPSITEQEAKHTAEQFLSNMGLDYLACERSEIVTGGCSTFYGDGALAGNHVKAYRLQYVRQVSGVPITYTNVETTSATGDDFIWNWAYENMTLIINDSGIVGMRWEAPYRLKDAVTEGATLLSFDKIKNVFEKMIIVGNSYYKEYDGDMNIEEARLGLARITAQNDLKSGLLIPVWDFFGTVTTHYEEGGQSRSYTIRDTGISWLTINAIDGTVIDRSLGY